MSGGSHKNMIDTVNPIDTIDKAMEFIYSTSWKGSKLDLSRITILMELLGNPQKKLKFVHIAGTNGKGSTAAMLASILTEAGYKTGLYTSPYIHTFGERMQINSIPIAEHELVKLANQLQKHVAKMTEIQESPTVFELITAMAFLHFYQNQCEIVVLEVGMGGRLDATNVIDTPEVAIITSIGLDHTVELGNTVEKIAGEKAGIIKPDGVAVCYPQTETVERVIREKCKANNTHVSFVDKNSVILTSQNLDGQYFEYGAFKDIVIPLLGKHQLLNATVAIAAIYSLQERGWNISESAIRDGLKKTKWPARFEVMQRDPVFIVDGAHNPQGVQMAVDNLCAMFPDKKFLFLFGVLTDKDYKKMTEILIPHADHFFAVTPDSQRALPAEDLATHLKQHVFVNSENIVICDSVENGVKLALEVAGKDDVICALGSLFMVGQVRECLQSL